MTDSEATTAATTGATYRERLYVTWYWWLLPLLAAVLLAAEVHLGYPGVRAWLPYVVLVPLTALLIWRVGRLSVRVQDGELWVGNAHLPLRYVGEVQVVPAKDKRRVLGPHLDPAAHVLHRGWVGPVVRVRQTDPEDPTPYWVFSTRHPDRLVEALRASD
ncbi:MAG: DUF3093 family protein [Actinophytocola sp.]|uniref:DUF3093 domain-containing protein n=1 Tax=Actinophytocola sp. TaxID=1872138 RepID=UPI0013281B42|nr:DUF3093 domain-containing protein [Actinophytocola sp.]MPZ86120.1 DUF3093 family protein [Actinophytocola sp.]